MRKKKDGWGEGRGVYVGWYWEGGFERVGGGMGIDLLQTIDHARRGELGRGLILFLRGFVSGGCYAFFLC